MVCALGMMTACKSTNSTEAQKDSALFTDIVQPTNTVFVGKTVEETVDRDTNLPAYYDFMPRDMVE